MFVPSIILGVVCVMLLVMLALQVNKNARLAVKNGVMEGRLEAMKERLAEREPAPAKESLTAEGIEEAVRHAGYVPDRNDNWIRFMVAGETFYIDTSRLPSLFVLKQYAVDTKELEMDLLKHAAHLMSDDLIIVKAIFCEYEDGTELRFLVAALDANNASFRENLARYINLIEDGHRKMNEIYEGLVKEKSDDTTAINPLMHVSASENNVMS